MYSAPSDALGQRIVDLVTKPGEARERLSEFAYTTNEPGNPLGQLEEALRLSIELEPLERRLRQAKKEGLIKADYLGEQIEAALSAEVIAANEAERLRDYHAKVSALMAVDDFDPSELGRRQSAPKKPQKAAKRKTAPRKKTAARKKTTTRKKAT
jgi:acyl-CoA dehydrogenase